MSSWPSFLVLIGAILAAIGMFWGACNQSKSEHELRNKADQIAQLTTKNAQLTTKNMDMIIGGDSFCYVTIANLDSNTNQGILMIVHQGDYPLYDINVRMVDLQKSRQIRVSSLSDLQKTDINLQLGNMIKGHAWSDTNTFDLGSSSNRDFNIFFVARNGPSNQALRLRKIDEKWTIAIKVEKNGKIVFEKIDDDFPKTEQGQVQW